jgi:hypothetical protein
LGAPELPGDFGGWMEKLWVYFAGFYGRCGGIKTQEEADNFTQPVRAWSAARPGSIAAFYVSLTP